MIALANGSARRGVCWEDSAERKGRAAELGAQRCRTATVSLGTRDRGLRVRGIPDTPGAATLGPRGRGGGAWVGAGGSGPVGGAVYGVGLTCAEE